MVNQEEIQLRVAHSHSYPTAPEHLHPLCTMDLNGTVNNLQIKQ